VSVSQRVLTAVLALLLGAQGIGKLLDMRLYVVALDRFRAVPKGATMIVAIAWVVLELVALFGLGAAALRPGRTMALGGAAAAVLDAAAYAALTIGTKARGIEVLNCTCFGAFLPQRLSTSVLIQDMVMVLWTLWTLRMALRLADGGSSPA
jgi:hypothetical protein